MPAAPSSLDSTALAARLSELARDTRNVDVDFILHLAEFDRRRAYLEAGFGSLWAYCLEALHLSEGSAGRRIHARRTAHAGASCRWPDVSARRNHRNAPPLRAPRPPLHLQQPLARHRD